MIGVDTNVLIRWLTADDAAAHDRVSRMIAQAGDDQFYLSDIVLIELVWVLTRTYKLSRTEAFGAVETLLDIREFICADRGLTLEAVRLAQQNGCDFADALVAVKNREANCTTTMTFDRRAARLASMTHVEDLLS